jgi:hypothetical protein
VQVASSAVGVAAGAVRGGTDMVNRTLAEKQVGEVVTATTQRAAEVAKVCVCVYGGWVS